MIVDLSILIRILILQECPFAERQKFLWRQYRFTCRCVACVGNWPTADAIKKSVARSGMSGKVDFRISTEHEYSCLITFRGSRWKT